MNMVVNDPLDPLAHSIEEYNSVIAPRIRAHSKNGKFGLMNPPIMYTPAEDSDPNARIEDALTGKREAIFQLETAKEPNQQPPK